MADVLEKFERVGIAAKIVVLLILMAAVGGAFYALAYQKLEKEAASLQRNITQINSRMAELRVQTEAIDGVRRELVDLCELYDLFLERLPLDRDVESLLRRVTSQAGITGVRLRETLVLPPVTGRQFNTQPLTVALLGSYDQVTEFFYLLSREPRIINVSNVSMTAERGGGRGARGGAVVGPTVLNVTARLSTYYASSSDNQGAEACRN